MEHLGQDMSGRKLSEQEAFWQGEFGDQYVERNSTFVPELEERAWARMLSKAKDARSFLECGSNIGRNLKAIRRILHGAELSLIEVNKKAFTTACAEVAPAHAFNGSILESSFTPQSFDLTFTSGVLIHIAPEELEANLRKIFDYSRRYILLNEYFSRQPVEIEYRGSRNKLFKQDFGKFFLDRFPVQVIDYGFLWGEELYDGGFDDMTWWLFQK